MIGSKYSWNPSVEWMVIIMRDKLGCVTSAACIYAYFLLLLHFIGESFASDHVMYISIVAIPISPRTSLLFYSISLCSRRWRLCARRWGFSGTESPSLKFRCEQCALRLNSHRESIRSEAVKHNKHTDDALLTVDSSNLEVFSYFMHT